MLKRMTGIIMVLAVLGLVSGCDKGGGDDGGEGGSEDVSLVHEDFNSSSYDNQEACNEAAYGIESRTGRCRASCDCMHQFPMGPAADDPEQNDLIYSNCQTGCESQLE